ncbi:MAG: CheR family methyltransferase [Cyanobacteriota bacterium]|nr:CheR family methyltransferase [Cyanobacteriota bacterium]
MTQELIQKSVELISVRTGLSIRTADIGQLQEKFFERTRVLGLSSLEDYYRVLEQTPSPNLTTPFLGYANEWQELINLLTVTESYFFRDSGQFNLLKRTILPKLIAQKRKTSGTPTLKIWSAACSSGEEPYSLAILLQELLPDLSDWNLSIIGTDINQTILDKAKRGIYGDWSFRSIDSQVKKRYFTQHQEGWKLDRSIREMVKFAYLNLVTDRFTDLNLKNIDLILCRNVFIYFKEEAIERAIEKFDRTLQPGGYLMTAHAELPESALARLQTLVFPNSAIYQRKSRCPQTSPRGLGDLNSRKPVNAATQPKAQTCGLPLPIGKSSPPTLGRVPSCQKFDITPPSPLPSTRSTSSHTPSHRSTYRTSSPSPSPRSSRESIDLKTLSQTIDRLLDRGAYPEAIQAAQRMLETAPNDLKGYSLIAQAYASLGDYQKATYYCVQAFALDSQPIELQIELHYLLARIAEVQGNTLKAKDLLRQIIYLEPTSVFAYLELAAVYRKERNLAQASKMQSTALRLLGTLPSGAIVDPIARLTAGEVLEQFDPIEVGL